MIDLSDETEALARRLADAQGTSVENVVRQALEASAWAAGIGSQPLRIRDVSPKAVAARRSRMDRLVEEIAAMPILDPRSPQEIMDDLNTL